MESALELETLSLEALLHKIRTQNCQSLSITTKLPVEEIVHFISPVISIFQHAPLLEFFILPQFLQEPTYDVVSLGGTFDYFHIGHQLLLLTAIQLTRSEIIIGITGDKLLTKKKYRCVMQDYEIRKKNVYEFIKRLKPELNISIVELSDPFGPTIIRPEIEALVVSQETLPGGHKINEIRTKEKNFISLQIKICKMISPISEDNIDNKISSSAIREHILEKNSLTEEQFIQYKNWWNSLQSFIQQNFVIGDKEQQMRIISEESWDFILRKYSEYWRHYHTNRHIFDMLEDYYKNYREKYELSEVDQIILETSIWFHDVQYLPISGENEENSALIAQKYLLRLSSLIQNQEKAQQFIKLVGQVKQAIISTKHHQSSNMIDRILIDIDMSILNSQSELYAQYAKNIRKEYESAVDKFAVKRIAFLKALDPSTVFTLETNIEKLIANINQEISQLQKQINQDL